MQVYVHDIFVTCYSAALFKLMVRLINLTMKNIMHGVRFIIFVHRILDLKYNTKTCKKLYKKINRRDNVIKKLIINEEIQN